MKTIQELNTEIKNIEDIYLNIRILNDNCKYLKAPKTPEEAEIKYDYIVFQGIIYAMDRMVIIELCKLFGKKRMITELNCFWKMYLKTLIFLNIDQEYQNNKLKIG